MGKLIVTEFVTLDGVAQAPGGPDEDRDGGFTHGGWQAPLLDEESGAVMFEQARSMDALLLGRRTYEIFAGYWPTAPEEIPFTGLLNGVPKYVASRTLAGPLDWEGSTVVAEPSSRASPRSRSATTRSTSSAVSTSCSHCCASASSTGCTCGCTRCSSAAASRCSPTAPCPPRCG